MSEFNPIAEFRQSLSRNNPCAIHPPIVRSDSPEMAALWAETVELCSDSAKREHLRWLARNDLFFLLVYLLNRKHFIRDERTARWTFERCNEVQDKPNSHMDLWPRESFKCLSVDTLVTLSNGERKSAGEISTADVVPSIDENGKFYQSRVLAVVDTGVKTVRTFTTNGGRQFTITDDHRMMGPNGTWPTGADLADGGWVAIPRIILRSIEPTMCICEAAYLGFMLSDGAITQRKAIFTNVDPPVIERFQSMAEGCGFTSEWRPEQKYVAVQGALNFQTRMGVQGHKATEKRIPHELFSQSEGHLWAFLSAFIDCDGHVTNGLSGHGVIISLANPGLIDDLRHLCDLLGIYGTVSKKRENDRAGFWTLSIYEQKALRRLSEKLTLSHPEKKRRLNLWANRPVHHDRSDPIPYGWEAMLEHSVDARRFRDYGARYPHPVPSWISRTKAHHFSDLDLSNRLKNYLDADVRWEKIESVSEPFLAETVDIQTTAKTFHANGVVSHNSEIISFGLTIQDILNDPEITFGIFSHNRPMAKDFLVLIKREFQDNEKLKDLFPDILWQEPKRDAMNASVSWSENEGITVRRKGNPKEATIEAWGLTDGQPTGKRYKILLYDDVVSRNAISEMMIAKTTTEFENSLLLTASDPPIVRYVATFQEIGDTTQQLADRKILKLRQHSPIDKDGSPAYCSDEKFTWFKKNLSSKTFALQVLLDPTRAKDESDIGFHQDWLVYYPEDDLPSRRGMNVYVLVDPAGNSTESNSRNVIAAIGLTADRRMWLLDMVWDKMDLEECWQALFAMVQRWQPTRVGYEKFGMQRDIEHFHYRMKEVNYPFTIVPLGGTHLSKNQRIERLIPICKDRRLLLPKKGIHKTLKDGTKIELVKQFVEHEYLVFPYSGKLKDMLDALALIANPDLGITWPRAYGGSAYGGGGGRFGDMGGSDGGWMTA